MINYYNEILTNNFSQDVIIHKIYNSFNIYYLDYFFYLNPRDKNNCYIAGWKNNKCLFTHTFHSIPIEIAINLLKNYLPINIFTVKLV